MADDNNTKTSEVNKNDDSSTADKENEPVLLPDGEKKREEREESKNDGDDIQLNIGEQYMVRRADDTWRKSLFIGVYFIP